MGLAPLEQTQKDSLRLITNTVSKIPDKVFDLMQAQFPKAALSLNYGMTETYRTASLPVEMALTHRDSVGFAVPGVELRIVDETGAPAAQGKVGEVIHVGAGIFHSYWDEPEKTAAVRFEYSDGTGPSRLAVRTGDFGYFDEDGRLCLKGRRDRQIKCMGVRLSLDEVEAVLGTLPVLKEVAVTAQPHDVLGAMITAHVVPVAEDTDAKALKKELNSFARRSLSPFMQPRLWDIRNALPRNTNGKIDYLQLGPQLGA
jgi:acyl-coenzyme A synthetase/AMP-(fatty) acid ligase